jgi:intraflagellar transport protein 122
MGRINILTLISLSYREAYELASLGVTEKDWKVLGLEALENMDFQVAKKAFHRINDCRSLLLINEVEVGQHFYVME